MLTYSMTNGQAGYKVRIKIEKGDVVGFIV